MSRKFKAPDGFRDITDYVEILGNGNCRLIDKGGKIIEGDFSHINLEFCLKRVDENIWVELPDDFPELIRKAKEIRSLGDKLLNA